MAHKSEKNSEPVDTEDVPSDFFDDFTKDEFIEGLSVIDSWDDGDKNRSSRYDESTLDSVKDIRELMRDEGRSTKGKSSSDRKVDDKQKIDEYYRNLKKKVKDITAQFDLDDVIRPGSRRDPNKTNEAIKRDKEVKVRAYLGKCLEESDELLPPGTELDHINTKKVGMNEKKKEPQRKNSREKIEPHSKRRSPHWSPKQKQKWSSPRRSPRRSPFRSQYRSQHISPRRSPRRSPHRSVRRSPRRSPRYSPRRLSPRRPRRLYSPHRSPHRFPRSRSPLPFRLSKDYLRHSRSRSRSNDNFLYPEASSSYHPQETVSFASQLQRMYGGPNSMYQQSNYYGAYDGVHYEYGVPPVEPHPQPVPAPPVPLMSVPVPPNLDALASSVPAMVPPPLQPAAAPLPNQASPYDALAQLVADGKLSKEDYLKLAPKGVSKPMDNNARVIVLSRCNQAYSRLTSKQVLPNRLVMLNELMHVQEPKSLAPKFCSPLKRQAAIEFHFTKASSAAAPPNKQVIDAVVAAIGLDRIAAKPRRRARHNTKDAAVQTTKMCCDACEVRESTKVAVASTSTDPDYFSVSTHTQVVEADLMSSQVVFTPSGSAGPAAPISIAHLTPAQLVSQLAARAKTLKADAPPPFGRRNPPYDYDARGGGPHYPNSYANYRY